ncbi:MAG: 50S ribosomal protein L25/general stress protein Ctc [Arenicella sp.]
MSSEFIVKAEVRTGTGTGDSRRVRHAGQVPCVVYGGGEDEQYLLLDHNKIMHQLEVEAFHSALVKIDVDGEQQRAILRDVQMHPYKAQVLHLDFQRVSRKDKIHMNVPVHLMGAEDAPGVKEGGIMSQIMNDVEIVCLGSDLPEYIEADVSALGLGEGVHLSELVLPEGVELAHAVVEGESDLSVATVMAPKVQSVETEESADVEVDSEEEATDE